MIKHLYYIKKQSETERNLKAETVKIILRTNSNNRQFYVMTYYNMILLVALNFIQKISKLR
jgi:hypothetical protein